MLVDITGLGPVTFVHSLWRVEDDNRVQAGQVEGVESASVDMQRPITDTPLIAARLLEGDMARTEELAVAVLEDESACVPRMERADHGVEEAFDLSQGGC